jgi:hypothetical protein
MYKVIKTNKKTGRQYEYLQRSYRVPGRRTPKTETVYLGPVGGGRAKRSSGGINLSGLTGSPLLLVPALPFMIARDLLTGNRVERLKDRLARGGRREVPIDNRLVFTGKGVMPADKWAAERSTMSDEAWARHVAGLKHSQVSAPPDKTAPTPQERAEQEYMALREQNQAQINAYWGKVEVQMEREQKANEQYAKEQAAAKATTAAPSEAPATSPSASADAPSQPDAPAADAAPGSSG